MRHMGQGTVPCPAVLSLSAINGTRNAHAAKPRTKWTSEGKNLLVAIL